ncbi:hypothetical protein E8E13_006913 [Curvularia kusanoi]|uniref:Xylanolytic transcriptional activator regulatory domain-containing protein n=1 Tax=Curvularia kusanoi TaxID=90978 RepID=A0A9P4TEW2_CURKU|nr:hypothetical protein E8E13_006913 [Curvularia kusanoi]
MATSLRLGKAKLSSQSSSDEEDSRRKVWWSICVFEKLLAFEMGRQSAITNDGLACFDPAGFVSYRSVTERSSSSDGERQEEVVFYRAITSLTKLLGGIGSRCVHIREQEETSEKEEIQRLVAEKVRITGESCLQLTKWAEALPDYLRPGSDLIYDPCTFPHAAFLSIHYHNALLVLTRNSILISESALRVTTDIMAKDQPWRHVIRNGPPMVANTARKIIRLFIESEENGTILLIPHTNASLHALYVLAVHLLKHPNTMLAETDIQLIGHAASLAQKRLCSGSESIRILDRTLNKIDELFKEHLSPNYKTFRRIGTPWSPSVTTGSGVDVSGQDHPTVSSDISMYTQDNGTGLTDPNFLGQIPPLDCISQDGYSTDALGYYGMDIGTWIGLDNMRWDEGQHIL